MTVLWTETFESGLGSWTQTTGGSNAISQSSDIAHGGTYSAKFDYNGTSPQCSIHRSAGTGIQPLLAVAMHFYVRDMDPRFKYRAGLAGAPMRFFSLYDTSGTPVYELGVNLTPNLSSISTGECGYSLCYGQSISATVHDDGGFAGRDQIHPNTWHYLVMHLTRGGAGPVDVYLDGRLAHSAGQNTVSLPSTCYLFIGDNRSSGASYPRNGGSNAGVIYFDDVVAATAHADIDPEKEVVQDIHRRIAS